MTLDLYTTTDDPRTANKTLTAVKTITTVLPTENLSQLTPKFMIEYDATVLTANYCYCAVFNRYYFIDNIELIKGNRMLIHCSVDVLKTYYNQYINCTGVAVRNENTEINAIPDKNLPIDPNREDIVSIVFNKDPFNIDVVNTAKCWQLTTNGGEPIE